MKTTLLLTIICVVLRASALGQYSNPFDPWRACNKALPEASKGNPIALHTCFLAAYVRMSDPYFGGEDLESMDWCMESLLTTLGDASFAEALAFERGEVQSAVGAFLEAKQLRGTPKTRRLVEKSPKIDFPLAQSNRDESKSPLFQRFVRYEKEHPAK